MDFLLHIVAGACRMLARDCIVMLGAVALVCKACLMAAAAVVVLGSLVLPVILLVMRWRFARKRSSEEDRRTSVAFFHPYCNAGGGGERVLWCAIEALQEKCPDVDVYVYTGDLDVSPADILKRASTVFNIVLRDTVKFVYLHKRRWVEAVRYPYFTLLMQSLGSLWLGYEALCRLQPDVFVDTTGHSFTLPLFRFVGGCRVACYVHYPTVTRDMLRVVAGRSAAHNNRGLIARSPFLTAAKLVYYRVFGRLYAWAGRSAQTVMVNSTWTEEHINALWDVPLQTHRVYPPCDVAHLKRIVREHADEDDGTVRIVSVGQFRPEKDHPLQLRAMYRLRSLLPEPTWERVRLVLVGSCRGPDDEARVQDMRDLCRHLSLEHNVEFHVNVPHEQLLRELARGSIGLHAMWNEHFGIGVVECMAAGLVTVAHRSGGPLTDIIETAEGSRTGFLATDSDDYADTLHHVLRLGQPQLDRIRQAARASVDRFSTAQFQAGFLRALRPLLRRDAQL